MGVRKFNPADMVFSKNVSDTFSFDLITNRVLFKKDYTYKAGFRVTTIKAGRAYSAAISKGYRIGTFCGVTLFEHQIAWFLIHGEWPVGYQIDHEDRNRLNNSPLNMRRVTCVENSRNKKIQRNNKSGVSGVTFNKEKKKWTVRINDGKRRVYLGSYESFDIAVSVRRRAEYELGYHENHGKDIAN